jgi:hypothetical protein
MCGTANTSPLLIPTQSLTGNRRTPTLKAEIKLWALSSRIEQR